MSRSFSTSAFKQLTNEVNNDPFLMLVRLSGTFGTFYFVNNTEQITSNSQVYTPFPVRVTLAEDDGDQTAIVTMELDNVALELIDNIRSETTPISVQLDWVFASAPDTVEMTLPDLLIRSVSYDASKIRATLTSDDFLNSRFPKGAYTPTEFPGIF